MRVVSYVKGMSVFKFLGAFLVLSFSAVLSIAASIYWPDRLVSFLTASALFMILGTIALELWFPSRRRQPVEPPPAAEVEADARQPEPARRSEGSWLSGVRARPQDTVEAGRDDLAARLEAAEREAERLRRIAHTAHSGIALTDGNGRIEYANPRLLHCFGVKEARDLYRIDGPFEVDGEEIFGFAAFLDHLSRQPDRDIEFSFQGKTAGKVFVGRASPGEREDRRGAEETVFHFIDISDRALRETRDRYYAYHDALTGAANRVSFWVDLDEAASEAAENRKLALIAIDLDRFKPVNDEHGHSAGDTVLRTVVTRIRTAVAGRSAVYRMGGDEFMVPVMVEDDEDALELAEAILAAIGEPIDLGNAQVEIGASCGIALMPDDTSSAKTLVTIADAALYASKNSDDARIHFFRDVVDQAPEVARAIEEGA